jgi:RNA polymerase sigma-70 factor (ECF subfamily)
MTEKEFIAVYDEHMPRILRYCAYRLGSRDDAEDITAETFARLLGVRSAPAPDRVGGWLFAVASNLCADVGRKAGRMRRAAAAQSDRDRTQPPAAEPILVDPAVHTALDDLSPAQHEVLFLRVVADLPFAEVGRVLGKSEAAVKMRYHRALRRVRRSLEEVEACPESKTEAE